MISRRGALRLGAGVAGVAATGGAVFVWRKRDGDAPNTTHPEPTEGALSSALGEGIPMFRGNAARTGEMPGPAPGLEHPIICRWTISPDGMGIGDPVVAHGMLFAAGGGRSRLAAVDLFTARELWNADQHGELYGPILGDGAVFASDGASSIHAFEAATGRQRWRSTVPSAPSTGAAVVVDQTLFLRGTQENVYAMDTTTGNERWSIQVRLSDRAGGALVAGNGLVFVSTESELIALDADSGDTRWTSQNVGARALRNDTLFAVGGSDGVNTLHALDPASGGEQWRVSLDQGFAELAVNDESVFVSTSNYVDDTTEGTLSALNAESGEELWTFESESPVSSPLIVDGLVIGFLGSGGFDVGELVALDVSTGEERWRLPTPGRVHSPVIVDGLIILRGKYMTAYGNLISPPRLGRDAVLRGSPSTTGISRGSVSAGADIDQIGARQESDGDAWVTVTIDGTTGWIPLDAIDPMTLPPEGEIYYMHDPT